MSLLSFIERKYGWNKVTEKINGLLCICILLKKFIIHWWRLLRAILNNKKIVIISVSMPQQMDNIGNLPDSLKSKGYEVFIFAEWDSKKYPQYNLDHYKKNFYVLFDCWRFLSFTIADIFLTPITGKHIYYPIKAKRMHCFHSIAGLEGYPQKGFDSFDVIFCASPYQYEELNEEFKKRGIKDKVLIKGGYPKIDSVYRKYVNDAKTTKVIKTVIYCPTYYSDSIYSGISTVNDLSPLIIEELIKEYRVIFRPHPLNLKHNNINNILSDIKIRFGNNPNFFYDDNLNYYPTYKESDLMLSDVSGTAFTYSLSFGKPVLFFDRGQEGRGIQFEKRELIGDIITSVEEILPKCKELLVLEKLDQRLIDNARNEILFNFNRSQETLLDTINSILENK